MSLLSEHIADYVAAAVRAYGQAVLASAESEGADAAAVLGRELLQAVFGTRESGGPLPERLAELVARPDDADALVELDNRVDDVLEEDTELEAALTETLIAFCRREFEAGNTQAMVDLADLLRRQSGGYSGCTSATIRTARSRSSGG